MKKNQYFAEIQNIQKMVNRLKPNVMLNEDAMFEDEFDNYDDFEGIDDVELTDDEEEYQEPQKQPETKADSEEEGLKQLDKMGEVDQIRRITLDGMRKLADTPEHPQFQALLKIFQICTKSVETNPEDQKQ